MTIHLDSVVLAAGFASVKLLGGVGLDITTERTNLLLNAVAAALLGIVVYFLKEDRKDFRQRLSTVEEKTAKHDRKITRLVVMNEVQTPVIFKLAGQKPPDIDRLVKLAEEPDSDDPDSDDFDASDETKRRQE